MRSKLSYVESMTQLFFMMLWAMVLRHLVSILGRTTTSPLYSQSDVSQAFFDLILAHRHRRQSAVWWRPTHLRPLLRPPRPCVCIVYIHMYVFTTILYTMKRMHATEQPSPIFLVKRRTLKGPDVSSANDLIIMSETPPMAQPEDDQTSKDSSSEATAPQASPKKMPNSQFHHHVVPTEKSGALNVYVQVGIYKMPLSIVLKIETKAQISVLLTIVLLSWHLLILVL